MNKDQVKGRAKAAAGAVKEAVGKVSGNTSMALKGKVEKAAGKVQAAAGDLKKDARKSR